MGANPGGTPLPHNEMRAVTTTAPTIAPPIKIPMKEPKGKFPT